MTVGASINTNNKSKKIPLSNATDKLFAQIRNLNFATVGNVLSQLAKRLYENYEERHQAKTVNQIKDFVGKLGNLQSEHTSLKLHTSLAEEITKLTLDSKFNKSLEIQQSIICNVYLFL